MRTRMITRTIRANVCRAMVTDIEKAEVINDYDVCIIGAYDEKTLEKKCKAIIEANPSLKYCCMLNVKQEEIIYGMTEEQFFQFAKPIKR